MLIRYLAAWLAILVLAVLNGIFREAVLLPNLSRPGAYLVSGSLLAALSVVVAISLGRWMRLKSASQALAIGTLWLGLTLAFEFGFGLVQGHTWPQMLEAYTFRDGNIWPLVLVAVLLAPLIGYRVRRR